VVDLFKAQLQQPIQNNMLQKSFRIRKEQLSKDHNQVMEQQLIAIISMGFSCKPGLSPEA